MEGITLKETASTFQIILDKKFFSAKQIKEIVSWFQTECVAKNQVKYVLDDTPQ